MLLLCFRLQIAYFFPTKKLFACRFLEKNNPGFTFNLKDIQRIY